MGGLGACETALVVITSANNKKAYISKQEKSMSTRCHFREVFSSLHEF
jgi:hypothetical protein